MDGARLILNARYFHIAQTGEKATKYAFVAEAAAGLVNYIATRESVIYNYDEHYKEVSATEAQREAINQFLEVSPDLELSREFKAYDEDRSAANASALISRAAQYVYGMTAEGDVKPSAPATRAQRERIQEFVNKVPAIRQTPEYSDYKASPTRENASEVLSHALEVGLANAADPETLEIKLYKTAAEIWLKDDHPENHIHLRLARMYEYGLGVPEDLSLAIDHYKAALKTPETEYKLGQLMQRIDGDATEIYAHYAAARVGMLYAEEHSPTSATAQQAVRLATMYRYGLGCDADHETAVHWYTVAAERGSIYAQQRLEVMEMQRIRQEQRAAEYAEKQQQQQNLSFAARLLNTIGNALCRQTLRDQQSATATTDRKQRRMQRRLKRALGQKEDYEQIFQ